MPAFPHSPITSESILVVAGAPAQLTALDSLLETTPHSEAPVIVIGAGTVGSATTHALKRKGVPVHVLERDPQARARLTGVADQVFEGDANDREALTKAGLEDAPSVVLTTNDDAVNVYLAIYCRRLKPDLRIVSRITHDRNLEAIHRAGADFVLSYSSLGAEAVMSLLEGHELVILGEGVDLFSVRLPPSLENKTLAETGIGSRTGLSVVAVRQDGSHLCRHPWGKASEPCLAGLEPDVSSSVSGPSVRGTSRRCRQGRHTGLSPHTGRVL